MRSIAEIRRFLFREPRAIKAPRKTALEIPLERNRSEDTYKVSAADREWGWNRVDLGFAIKWQVVKSGDRLQITSEYIDFDRNRPVHEINEMVYSDSDEEGQHRFYDLNDSKGLPPSLVTFGPNIVHWQKVKNKPGDEHLLPSKPLL